VKLKNELNKNYYLIVNIHKEIKKFINNKNRFAIKYFSVYLHKKLTYYLVGLKTKFFNFSNGQILGKKSNKIKFFKKSKKSYPYVINKLNRKFYKKFKSINIFYCKNFNLRNYNWLKKFFNLIKPKIKYLVCTGSWNYINLKKKRIKRKIYRNLIKNSKLV